MCTVHILPLEGKKMDYKLEYVLNFYVEKKNIALILRFLCVFARWTRLELGPNGGLGINMGLQFLWG